MLHDINVMHKDVYSPNIMAKLSDNSLRISWVLIDIGLCISKDETPKTEEFKNPTGSKLPEGLRNSKACGFKNFADVIVQVHKKIMTFLDHSGPVPESALQILKAIWSEEKTQSVDQIATEIAKVSSRKKEKRGKLEQLAKREMRKRGVLSMAEKMCETIKSSPEEVHKDLISSENIEVMPRQKNKDSLLNVAATSGPTGMERAYQIHKAMPKRFKAYFEVDQERGRLTEEIQDLKHKQKMGEASIGDIRGKMGKYQQLLVETHFVANLKIQQKEI